MQRVDQARRAALLALLAVGLAGGLSGWSRSGSGGTALTANADASLAAQAALEKSGLDFNRLVVVRLRADGRRVEATSVAPAVVASALVRGQPAKTIFRLNEAHDGLILFSRDAAKGAAYRTEISLAELESKRGLVFPVVQADGSLRDQAFKLEQIIRP